MTYNVFGGTLNLTQSTLLYISMLLATTDTLLLIPLNWYEVVWCTAMMKSVIPVVAICISASSAATFYSRSQCRSLPLPPSSPVLTTWPNTRSQQFSPFRSFACSTSDANKISNVVKCDVFAFISHFLRGICTTTDGCSRVTRAIYVTSVSSGCTNAPKSCSWVLHHKLRCSADS